jgi:hypothetical protein
MMMVLSTACTKLKSNQSTTVLGFVAGAGMACCGS